MNRGHESKDGSQNRSLTAASAIRTEKKWVASASAWWLAEIDQATVMRITRFWLSKSAVSPATVHQHASDFSLPDTAFSFIHSPQ
jgi:hypothetical protein